MRPLKQLEQLEEPEAKPEATLQPSGQDFITQKLHAIQESHEAMIKVMDQLQGECIYCALTVLDEPGVEPKFGGPLHAYSECPSAKEDEHKCEFERYRQWREQVNFG